MDKKSKNNKIYDILVFITVVFSFIFWSVTVSSNVLNSNQEKVGILKEDPNTDIKENHKASLADDVCDDCDDDDDDDGPVINKKPTAYIYEVEPNPAHEFESISFIGYGEDEDGEIIGYRWESDIEELISNEASFIKSDLASGIHMITFFVQDNKYLWSDPANISLEVLVNQPPIAPVIAGNNKAKPGEQTEYNFITTDPEDHDIYYYIDWDDGSFEEWIGPHSSDEEVPISHTWNEKGSYTIRAKAKDEHGLESEWGTIDIQMSHSEICKNSMLQKFINLLLDNFLSIINLLK